MIAVDSSVAIAAFGDWHQQNEAAVQILNQGAALPAHALLETYSVLTGFPAPYRAAPDLVAAWLDERFAEVLAPPSISQQRSLIRTLAGAGRIGGAIYDGLVAITALHADATLVTADTRAAAVYELVRVESRYLV